MRIRIQLKILMRIRIRIQIQVRWGGGGRLAKNVHPPGKILGTPLPSALNKEHPALQNMNFINSFIFFWAIFALLNLDPGTPLNPDPIRIRIHDTDFSY
jgi:hypothetical protein